MENGTFELLFKGLMNYKSQAIETNLCCVISANIYLYRSNVHCENSKPYYYWVFETLFNISSYSNVFFHRRNYCAKKGTRVSRVKVIFSVPDALVHFCTLLWLNWNSCHSQSPPAKEEACLLCQTKKYRTESIHS